VDFSSSEKFWASFGNSFRGANKHVNIPAIKSADDFRGMLESANMDLFLGKNVVLFIDEFDKLYTRASQSLIDDVLDLFRGIKHQRGSYLLQVHINILGKHKKSFFIFTVSLSSLLGRSPFSN